MTSMFLATLLAAAQASTAPATLEVTEPRNAAVGFALTTSLGVERMARACSAVPDVAPRFEAASQAWLARNKPYADAAHGWLEHVKGLIAADQGAGVAEASRDRRPPRADCSPSRRAQTRHRARQAKAKWVTMRIMLPSGASSPQHSAGHL